MHQVLKSGYGTKLGRREAEVGQAMDRYDNYVKLEENLHDSYFRCAWVNAWCRFLQDFVDTQSALLSTSYDVVGWHGKLERILCLCLRHALSVRLVNS